MSFISVWSVQLQGYCTRLQHQPHWLKINTAFSGTDVLVQPLFPLSLCLDVQLVLLHLSVSLRELEIEFFHQFLIVRHLHVHQWALLSALQSRRSQTLMYLSHMYTTMTKLGTGVQTNVRSRPKIIIIIVSHYIVYLSIYQSGHDSHTMIRAVFVNMPFSAARAPGRFAGADVCVCWAQLEAPPPPWLQNDGPGVNTHTHTFKTSMAKNRKHSCYDSSVYV